MIIKDAFGNTAEVHLYDKDTGLDFVEEYLNAGSLEREADGTYLVGEVPYIIDYTTDARKRAWLAGYRKALAHCNEQVSLLEAFEGTNLTANIRYQGAAQVRDVVASWYREYRR